MSLALACPEFRHLQSRLSRRDVLQWGSLGVLGLGLGDLLAARGLADATAFRSDAPGFGKAKACILMFMWGGPSHIDTWDMKPNAPREVRGEFDPISTNVEGIQISEHLPNLARHADKYAIVRSVTHDDPAHLSSVHHVMTGRHAPQVKSDAVPPSRKDWPHVGSLLTRLRPSSGLMPPFVTLPWHVSHPAAPGGVAPGQNGGWLGAPHDPFVVTGDPSDKNFRVSGLSPVEGVSLERLASRRALLGQLDHPAGNSFGTVQAKALDLLTSQQVEEAFRVDLEPAEVRKRYGRHIHGQCLLLARRLIEAGSSLVCVNWHNDGHNFWDTHGDNFRRLKRDLMPPSDRGFAALLEDLSERGLLDETLLVWVGEFGRNPKITRENAGRDHWPWCGSAVFAGGGIQGGQVYGRSDPQGGRPAENPVAPADVTATVYHALGIPPDLMLPDREDRPIRVTEGNAIQPLFG